MSHARQPEAAPASTAPAVPGRPDVRPAPRRPAGPLAGLRVVELGGIGPGPHAAMVLADLGADVVRVERPAGGLQVGAADRDLVLRGRRSVAADVKEPGGLASVLDLVASADVLLEVFRPGVAERLGLGPDACLARQPRLVYARMTGWGQTGPWATRAGHDLNYLGLTGTLHALGRAGGPPTFPANLVADYGGGSMLVLVGILAALVERERSGRGQVVDAAMVDGVSLLSQPMWSLRAQGAWSAERGTNLLDGGAPFYDVYPCADGRYVAVGALEPQFYAALLDGLGLSSAELPEQQDRAGWPRLREAFTTTFAARPRDEWAAVFDGVDACVTPVLEPDEVAGHPHLAARGTLLAVDGDVQAAPAPRFSRTPAGPPEPPGPRGGEVRAVLEEWLREDRERG
ncbi:CoA transferase [Geodermatophilus sp. YIM 151500]|uniref:CaiB/BaiF CoA transferase family protein n=1 Tax=Geodermatophilus sp. YIM 151500 TaxID=2984531 RepID=UPI0021E480DD|nr:CaiB/BaiF CoA-transferase family protein [Geodermatophilus sp. YIM 151500]MCV2487834.1 CoA transferase [Geodermatophilus sp. YIM 151500]